MNDDLETAWHSRDPQQDTFYIVFKSELHEITSRRAPGGERAR